MAQVLGTTYITETVYVGLKKKKRGLKPSHSLSNHLDFSPWPLSIKRLGFFVLFCHISL